MLLRENPECRSNLQGKRPSGSGENGFLLLLVVCVVVDVIEAVPFVLVVVAVLVVCSVRVLDRVAGVEREDTRTDEEDSMISVVVNVVVVLYPSRLSRPFYVCLATGSFLCLCPTSV